MGLKIFLFKILDHVDEIKAIQEPIIFCCASGQRVAWPHSILRNKELTVQMEEVGENFNLPIIIDNPYCCKFIVIKELW